MEANYIELISTEISSGGIRGIQNTGGIISANSLKIDSNGLFRNQDGGNINISGLLEVTNAERFINNNNITADTLTITTDLAITTGVSLNATIITTANTILERWLMQILA